METLTKKSGPKETSIPAHPFELLNPLGEVDESWVPYQDFAKEMFYQLVKDAQFRETCIAQEDGDNMVCTLQSHLDFCDTQTFTLLTAIRGMDIQGARSSMKRWLLENARVGDHISSRHLGWQSRMPVILVECPECRDYHWSHYNVGQQKPKSELCIHCSRAANIKIGREKKNGQRRNLKEGS